MRYLTTVETPSWCRERGIGLDAQGTPERSAAHPHTKTWNIPKASTKVVSFARRLEGLLKPWDRMLLWPTSWNIWPSSENWHAYYKLRRSYGDFHLIEEAPGHLFLGHEGPDFVSFLQLGITFGWDMHVLAEEDRTRLFISHDEWFEISTKNDALISDIDFLPL
jgi:hypothetical protein